MDYNQDFAVGQNLLRSQGDFMFVIAYTGQYGNSSLEVKCY